MLLMGEISNEEGETDNAEKLLVTLTRRTGEQLRCSEALSADR